MMITSLVSDTINIIQLLHFVAIAARELDYYLDKYAADTVETLHADFSLRLLSYTAEDELPAVLSPLSLTITLSFVANYAAGTTKAQITDTLARGIPYEHIREHYTTLVDKLSSESNSTTLTPGTLLLIRYCKENGSKNSINRPVDYMAEIKFVDCNGNDDYATYINEWVSNRTGLSQKVYKESSNGPDWLMLLIDTFYYKAAWEYEFETMKTSMKDFYITKDRIVKTKMMSMWAFDKFRYTEDADVQVLGLPYEMGSDLHLYIFLPRLKCNLKNVERELTGRHLLYLVARSKVVDIEVEIPKFSFHNSFELNLPLASMGIVEAFTSRAQFPLFTNQQFYISLMEHSTQFQLNEKGSYPDEITLPPENDEADKLWQGGHIKFIANHPFMFALLKNDIVVDIGHFSE